MNGPMCYFQVFLLRDGGSPAKAELIIRLHVGGARKLPRRAHRFSVFGSYEGPWYDLLHRLRHRLLRIGQWPALKDMSVFISYGQEDRSRALEIYEDSVVPSGTFWRGMRKKAASSMAFHPTRSCRATNPLRNSLEHQAYELRLACRQRTSHCSRLLRVEFSVFFEKIIQMV